MCLADLHSVEDLEVDQMLVIGSMMVAEILSGSRMSCTPNLGSVWNERTLGVENWNKHWRCLECLRWEFD